MRSRTRPSSASSPSDSRATTISPRAFRTPATSGSTRVDAAAARRRVPGAGVRRRRRRGIRRHLARSGFRPVDGVRPGRHRDRGHPRLCAAHAAAARRRRRGDDRRDPRRRHAGRGPRPAGGRRRKPGRLPLCAVRFRPCTMPICSTRSTSTRSRRCPRSRLRRGRCPDRARDRQREADAVGYLRLREVDQIATTARPMPSTASPSTSSAASSSPSWARAAPARPRR